MNLKFNNTLVMISLIASVFLVIVLVGIGVWIADSEVAEKVVVDRGFDLAALVISGILAKVVLGRDENQKEENEKI